MNNKFSDCTITEAKSEDVETAALLMDLAFDEFSDYLFGTNKIKDKLEFFKKLWVMGHNRLSSQYSYLMRNKTQPIGLLSCYSAKVIDKMFLPSLLSILRVNPGMLKYIFFHPHYLYTFLTSPEASEDEYYIFMLAVLPQFQKQGIGTKLLNFAEQQAKNENYRKLSLLVRTSNVNAIDFYEKYGFRNIKTYNRKPMNFFKMVKEID